MVRTLRPPRVIRSVSLSYEFDALCRKYEISLSEAMRVGISLILAERGEADYDNSLNISRKLILLREELERVSNELEMIKRKERND